MREITSPTDVDSLGKLNEWLAECGMPQEDARLAIEERGAHSYDPVEDHLKRGLTRDEAEATSRARSLVNIEHEQWGFGFKFERGDREASNVGYRTLLKHVAGGLYARFRDHRYQKVVWRIRPELSETERLMKLVNADGTDCDLGEDADEIPEGAYKVDTGYSSGQFHCRLVFVMAAE